MNLTEEKRLRQLIDYKYSASEVNAIDHKLSRLVEADDALYIVIDDDPTGGQTVHDIDLYTSWEYDTLLHACRNAQRMFYVMTNSRSLQPEDSRTVNEEIVRRLRRISELLGRTIRIISRGDSTLRGHYPLEVDAIKGALGCEHVREIHIPYFREGSRYTCDDTHYMIIEDRIIPVGESEFCKDKTFGYRASNLKEWICEKTKGKIGVDEIAAVSLDMLRSMDYESIRQVLKGDKEYIVVNAANNDDLKVFAIAYLTAANEGETFIVRSAAAWPKVIGMIADQPLLSAHRLGLNENSNGGLVVVGSHVQRTTDQLAYLQQEQPELAYIELNQHLVMHEAAMRKEIERAANYASDQIKKGRTCVIYTRRERIDLNTGNPEDELRITKRIADSVTETVRRIKTVPRYIVSKGGITSSDIAVKALGIRHAVIAGQVANAVPVWRYVDQTSGERSFYVIFPGNVGQTRTLSDVVARMEKEK